MPCAATLLFVLTDATVQPVVRRSRQSLATNSVILRLSHDLDFFQLFPHLLPAQPWAGECMCGRVPVYQLSLVSVLVL
jgi:hypothetical protein